MFDAIETAATWLKAHTAYRPEIAIVLGSGLGNLSESIENKDIFPYKEIPHFPVSTVEGHQGNLIFGQLGGKQLMAMQGRFHYYEGYSMKEVTFPIRVMKALGIKIVILSNAAGGLDPDMQVGDIMLIEDHLNLFPEHPLRGRNDTRLGTRFPDMTEAYSKRLRKKVLHIAKQQGLTLRQGVYVGWQGPTFETPSEYQLLHQFGANATGMSTVPEVIVARHANMEVLGLSIITNCAAAKEMNSHEDVQKAADAATPKMSALIHEFIRQL